MSLPIFIHIGFPKTGTTTHQAHLFANHSQINYIGKPYQDDFLREEIGRLVREESLTYDSGQLKEYIAKYKVNCQNQGKKLIVISEELLVSASKVRDKGVVAQRLNDVFSPAKIIITIRNQWEMLKSAYINGGRLLKNVPIRYKGIAIQFNEWLDMSFENSNRSYIGNIRYYDTIEYYSKLFGKENIGVFLFEEFVEDKEKYINQLSNFLGIDANESVQLLTDKHENTRLSQSQIELELYSSKFGAPRNHKFISSTLNKILKLKYSLKSNQKAKVEMSDVWLTKLKDFYREGNLKLIKNYNLPIDRYGYPI